MKLIDQCLNPAPGKISGRLVAVLFSAGLAMALQGCHSNASSDTATVDPTAYCTQTVLAAFDACMLDVMEEFALAGAECINIEDDADRAECTAEADAERTEEDALCAGQRTARQEVCTLLGESRYDPDWDTENFVDPLTIGDTTAANAYFPLAQGNVWVYEDGDETITVTVTDMVVEIDGVDCITVTDVVEEDGETIEFTDDWYAQDVDGNVWYCGELSRNFEDGMLVDLEGSFRQGEDGAKAGILMKAAPMVGDAYRQEWYLSEAEDLARVISLAADESAPGGDCMDVCLQTEEFTPLEPGDSEYKFFAPGVGLITAYHVDEPDEREELISFTATP